MWPDRREQAIHVVAGKPVEDPRSVPPGHDQASPPQHLEVGGGPPDPDLGSCGQGLDAPLPLGEQIEDLDPAGTGEGLADAGELLVESVLRHAIARGMVTAIRWHGSSHRSDCRHDTRNEPSSNEALQAPGRSNAGPPRKGDPRDP